MDSAELNQGPVCIKLQGLQNGQLVLVPSHVCKGRGTLVLLPEMRCPAPFFHSVFTHSSQAALRLIRSELRVEDDVI